MIEQVKRGHFRGRRGDCRRRHHRHCCGRRRVVTVDFRCMQAVLPVKRFGHESWMQPEGLWGIFVDHHFLTPMVIIPCCWPCPCKEKGGRWIERGQVDMKAARQD